MRRLAALGFGLVAAGACSDGSTGPNAPEGEPNVAFGAAEVTLGAARSGQIELRNSGTAAAGPIELRAGQVRDAAGQPTLAARIDLSQEEVATLNAGASRTIGLTVSETDAPPPGAYGADVTAHLAGEQVALARVSFSVPVPPAEGGTVSLEGAPASMRQGDVVAFAAAAVDSAGAAISDPLLAWRVEPAGAGFAAADGRIVAYGPGQIRVVVSYGSAADTAVVQVAARGLSGALTQLGAGAVPERFTSDLWAHGSHAYTGTWSQRIVAGDTAVGNTLVAWNIASPTAPQRTDSVRLDARVVNDVKVSSDGALAVATHEVSSDARNGVTVLDLSSPAHPAVIGRFTDAVLSPGVHNVWIDGRTLYVVVDGASPASGLYIVDISDPANPEVLSHFYAGSSFLHDVLVRDGLAFLSHWNAGLVILDVGNGIAGGSAAAPVEVSRILLGGQTHNAWYWPARGYVFVGEEDFAAPGIMHVVDVNDLLAPVEVATFRVPGDAPHNFWLDESAAVLYLAWYANGLRALDVSGALLGELEKQGREIASLRYGTADACPGSTSGTCTWAPQLHAGNVWVSDMNRGLIALRPDF
jgi:hypothetical protein